MPVVYFGYAKAMTQWLHLRIRDYTACRILCIEKSGQSHCGAARILLTIACCFPIFWHNPRFAIRECNILRRAANLGCRDSALVFTTAKEGRKHKRLQDYHFCHLYSFAMIKERQFLCIWHSMFERAEYWSCHDMHTACSGNVLPNILPKTFHHER